MPQVYEYVHLTKETDLLLCLFQLESLPRFLWLLVLVQPFAVSVSAKVPLPILGN